MKTSLTLAVAVGLAGLLAASSSAVAKPAEPGDTNGTVLTASGAFGDGTKTPGFAYDQKMIPAGSSAMVLSASAAKTVTSIRVAGLMPNHQYGAHLHQKTCGTDPNAAGPHYQNIADPVKPSVDPKYANAQNEVWLDFTTDDKGAASATVTNPWQFHKVPAQSFVIHMMHTMTHPGHAGTAGARLACLSLKPVGE